MNPVDERIDDQPTHDEPAIKSLRIDLIRIPFAKHIVRAFVDWMQVIMRPHVETQLSHPVNREMRRADQIVRQIPHEGNRRCDQLFIRSDGRTDIAEVQRQGTESFAGIDFRTTTVFQNCHRSISDEMIELLQCGRNDQIGLVRR